ncbi:hypothetical protein RB213_016201 [Colletotrichum asianum]
MAFVVIDEARQQFDQQIDFSSINVIMCLGPAANRRQTLPRSGPFSMLCRTGCGCSMCS